MKKLAVLVLTIVLALSAVAFTACAESQTVIGECHYESWGTMYGAKVEVTVKGDFVFDVRLFDDSETDDWFRTTKGWDGFDAAEAAYANWIEDTFVGKRIEEVKAFVANPTAEDEKYVGESTSHISGATVSSARIILAVQDALSKLAD